MFDEAIVQAPAPTRRVFRLPGRGPSAELAALEFGDVVRPLDVLFLHANGFNARTYRTVLQPLSERLRVLAVDLRGHGRSPLWSAPADRGDWFDLRDDILALLPQVADRPIVLAGHSMGGAVALMSAVEAPSAARALVLFDPVVPSAKLLARVRAGAPPDSVEGALRRRARFTNRAEAFDRYAGRGVFTTWPDEALRDYLEDGLQPATAGDGYELSCSSAWEAANFRTFAYDPPSLVPRLLTPATILRAEIGSTCSIRSASDLPLGPLKCRVSTVPGTTHFLPLERPELVRAALLAAAGPLTD